MSNYFNIKNDPILNPVGNVSLGSASHPYENIYTTGNLVVGNSSFNSASLNVPKISAIVYPGDDTAVDTAGSQTVTLTGSGFMAGAKVLINQSYASVVTVVNDTTITFTTPAQNAGSYVLYLINTDGGTAIAVPGIQYSGVPVWTTAAGSLGTVYETGTFNTTVTATGDAPVTYSLYTGTLPTGANLNANGTITGTSVATASPTTYTFTIRSTDAQNQDTDRTFSITVNPDQVTWSSPADGTAYAVTVDTSIGTVTLNAAAASGQTVSYTANTLPTGISLSGNAITGTPTTTGNTTTLLTATSAVTNRSATRTISWVVSIGADTYFPYVTTVLSAASTTPFTRDASTNNFAVTIVGDTRPYNFNPYTPGYYSNYFDGTGDYLSLAANAAFAFGTGDFTVEAWIYRTGGSGNQPIAQSDAIGSSTNDKWWFAVAGGGLFFGTHSSGGFNIVTTTSFNEGTWYHVAVSRASGTMYMFVNGVSTAFTTTGTPSGYSLSQNGFVVGGMSNSPSPNYWTGYISNFRMVKGSATYTTSFTPPTTPLTAIANTSLLTCQSNRLIDNSTNAFTITKNGDTTVKPFNPYTPNTSYSTYGSTYFDGTGDYLTTVSSSALDISTTDWTVQGWYYPTVYSSSNNVLVYIGASTGDKIVIATIGTAGSLYYLLNGSGVISSSTAAPLNAWSFFALVKSGSTTTLYLNGVSLGTTSSVPTSSSKSASIGADAGGAGFQGYMSDVRVLKGTANTAIPTTPLTAVANTSLLTCQSNQPVANNTFLDNSTNNFAITRNGNTTQGTFSPYGENWSNYFDGTGDYLNVSSPPTTLREWWNTDFTIECWVYPTTYTGWYYNDGVGIIGCIVGNNTYNSGVNYWSWGINASGYLLFYYYNGGAVYGTPYSAGGAIPLNQWTHIAFTNVVGSGYKFWINGVGSNFTAVSGTPQSASTTPLTIGAGYNSYINGYVSNFRIVKGTAVYTTNFTPSTTPLQPIAGTSLLTCQSPNFVDRSANNFSITRNGDVSAQKFGPFAGTALPTPYYGTYFDTGSRLAFPAGTAFAYGTGAFTMEAWVNPSTYQSGAYAGSVVFCQTVNGANYLMFQVGGGGEISFVYGSGGGTAVSTAAGSAPLNTWTHIACAREGTGTNQFKIYVNGTVGATATLSYDFTNTTYNPSIGNYTHSTGDLPFKGHISNVRIVKGQALYTTTFTPSTTPLTTTSQGATASNVSLIACQSSTLIDTSTNAWTATITGTVTPRTYSPFTVAYSTKQSYTPSVYGGSMYFDGTGDYLSTGTTALYNFGTNNFTIEFWYYPITIASANSTILASGNASWGTGAVVILGGTSNTTATGLRLAAYDFNNVGNVSIVYDPVTVVLNQWIHYAFTRVGNNFYLYRNGVQISTNTWTGSLNFNYNNATKIGGGSWDSAYITGYLADLRILNGTAIYTSNFVPLNAPLQAVQNSVLLLNGTSGGIYDSSENAVFETVGDAKLSTSTVKFAGSTSMYFDGTGDYLFIPASQNFAFGSGNFTIEFWGYNLTGAGNWGVFSFGATAGADYAGITMNGGGGLYLSTTGSSWTYSNVGSLVLSTNDNQWHHYAVVRNGGTLLTYKDGVQQGSVSISGLLVNNNGVGFFGAKSDSLSAVLNGYISDLRITKGVARYTANFTAPTSAFITK